MSLVQLVRSNEDGTKYYESLGASKEAVLYGNSSIKTNIVGKGIREIKKWARTASGDDLSFDPPMPDSNIPTNMLGEPQKNEGWSHTYTVTTDPGRQPVLTFPGHSNLIHPTYDSTELAPSLYRVDVYIGTEPDSTNETLTIDFDDIPVGVENEKDPNAILPEAPNIANYPNPFNPGTTIEYELKKPTNVQIRIYNILQELVEEVYKGNQPSGTYSIRWDGKGSDGNPLPSGVYLLNILTPGHQKTIKMMKLK